MKIIAIEGLDKSGKASATRLLTEYLKTLNYNVVQSEFHRYDTPTGKLIQDWLYKRYDVDQQTIELIMAADKQAQQKWFGQLEEDGVDFLILDRYTTSQKVYSEMNGILPEWIGTLQFYTRRPDVEILLDIPSEVSMARKGKHGENDRYESDKALLDSVRASYLEYFETRSDCYIVSGLETISEVHSKIIELIKPYL